jgi:putative copper export protein
VVVWRSQSAADGHILRGPFLFTLALPDGTIPALSGNTSSAWDVLLFFTMTMSGHAATVNSSFVIFPLMVDWLHLLAAAFWIGGMLYIAIIYLPILRFCSLAEQAFSLTSVLPYYVP